MPQTEAHAEFSASGSERWLNCPGSIELSKKAPPSPDSEYSREGTEAHACLEFLLKNRDKIGNALKTALKMHPAEMVEHVKTAADWVVDTFNAEKLPAHLLLETRVDSSSFTCAGQFGTLDVAVVRPFGRLTVIDYKHGAGVAVDVADEDGKLNSQLVYYALGLMAAYPDEEFTEVELVIIQPRAFHESGDIVRSVVVPAEEVEAWIPVFKQGVRACRSGLAHQNLSPGKWCRWCPAAVICPELKEKAMKDAQVAFSEARGVETLPDIKTLALPNLSTILKAADKLEDWIAKVRDHARHVLETGGTVDGWKLVQKRGQRKWKDEAAVEKAFGQRAYAPRKVLSPAQFEKAVAGTGEWVAKHTTKESSGTTLAPAEDPRPEVKPLEKVFAALPAKRVTKK